MQEIWKAIPDYEGSFEVSNLGNFRSLDRKIANRWGTFTNYPGKLLKVEVMEDGYKRIVLMQNAIKKRYMCHRLVAQTFIPNIDNLPYINHKDGNRGNNCVDNLEWCTQTQNEQHAINVLGKTMKGKTFPKKVFCVELNRVFNSMRQAVLFLGSHACNEGIKKAIEAHRLYHGYTFQFVNDESSTTIENTSIIDGSE